MKLLMGFGMGESGAFCKASAKQKNPHGQAESRSRSGSSARRLTGQAAIEPNCGSSAGRLAGQAAIEMLVMIGFALAFIIPLALLFFTYTGTQASESSLAQAKVSVRTIASEAGSVYLQGAGAKKAILVNYPEGIVNGSVQGGLVSLRLNSEGGAIDVTSPTFANVSGNLSGKRIGGIQRINLVNVDGIYVNVTYG